jgi:hypothetical protein
LILLLLLLLLHFLFSCFSRSIHLWVYLCSLFSLFHLMVWCYKCFILFWYCHGWTWGQHLGCNFSIPLLKIEFYTTCSHILLLTTTTTTTITTTTTGSTNTTTTTTTTTSTSPYTSTTAVVATATAITNSTIIWFLCTDVGVFCSKYESSLWFLPLKKHAWYLYYSPWHSGTYIRNSYIQDKQIFLRNWCMSLLQFVGH